MAGKPSEADLLPLPKIPKPKADDPEDVAWALSTAEAMWNRAENADAIKWIQRAAEAASEAEADDRALELAKAAAELKGLLVKVDGDSPTEVGPSFAPPPPPPPAAPPSAERSQSQAPAPAVPSRPPPAPAPMVTQSRPPPAPVVATTPRAPSVSPPRAPSVSPPRAPGSAPASAPASARPAPSSPAKAPTPARASPPQASLQKVTHSRAGERRRRSNNALEGDARVARQAEIVSRAGGEQEVTKPHGMPIPIPKPAARRRSRPAPEEMPDATEIGARPVTAETVEGGVAAVAPPPSSRGEDDKHDTDPPPVAADTGTDPRLSRAEEMDQWPTQSLARAEHESLGDDDQSTRIDQTAYKPTGRRPAELSPDGLRASQAVRVIVWRGPDGVHVAPAGTTVSAITVDALLVALDPNADLAAWLKG